MILNISMQLAGWDHRPGCHTAAAFVAAASVGAVADMVTVGIAVAAVADILLVAGIEAVASAVVVVAVAGTAVVPAVAVGLMHRPGWQPE